MPSQERKEEQQKLLQKESQNCLSIKISFDRNEPSTNSHTNTHSLDLQNDLLVSPEIIQPEETSNYNHPNSVPNESNGEHIKNSKYPNFSFNGIPEKNQLKYTNFPKTILGKSSQSFSSN